MRFYFEDDYGPLGYILRKYFPPDTSVPEPEEQEDD